METAIAKVMHASIRAAIILQWHGKTLLLKVRCSGDVQAWMVSQAPVTQHSFLQSSPKVHSGFHAAWHVSGLRAAVTQLIKDKIPVERAPHMTVFLTGACTPWQSYA